MEMLKSVSQAFKVREIRAKMIFTILMLAVFRLGCCIPVPGLSATALQAMQNQSTEGIMGMANLFSGGAECYAVHYGQHYYTAADSCFSVF